MAKMLGSVRMQNSINEAIIRFVNMTSEERIKYINGYSILQPYQKVALLQSKRYMNSAEKKVFSEVRKACAEKSEQTAVESEQIQPEK